MLRLIFDKREQASLELDQENLPPEARATLRMIEAKARELQKDAKPMDALELSDVKPKSNPGWKLMACRMAGRWLPCWLNPACAWSTLSDWRRSSRHR